MVESSYFGLVIVIGLQSCILIGILRETQRYRDLTLTIAGDKSVEEPAVYGFDATEYRLEEWHFRSVGKPLTSFEGRRLDSTTNVTEKQLQGRSGMLLFISCSEFVDDIPPLLPISLNYLWKKIDGRIYIVCQGTEAECRRIRDECHLSERYGDDIWIIADAGGTIKATFGITRMPAALMIDRHGLVIKAGTLSLTNRGVDSLGSHINS